MDRDWRATLYRAALAASIGLGLVVTWWAIIGTNFADVEAYWSASRRLMAGEPLYPAFADTPDSMFFGIAYRYAPWFAVAWAPLALLPYDVAVVLWGVLLLAAFAYVAWRTLRARAWIPAALLLPFLFDSLTDGNVQPILVASLIYGVERRSGPAWIAVSASLKGVPLAFALVYIGRREWGKAAVTAVLTALLLAPMLLFDLSHYPTAPGRTLLFGTLLYPIVIGALAVATVRWRRWDLAGATAAAATPRFWFYDLTWILVQGAASGPRATATRDRARRGPAP